MRKTLFLLLTVTTLFCCHTNSNNTPISVSELISSDSRSSLVHGVVEQNFMVVNKQVFEFSDLNNEESVIVYSEENSLPRLGDTIQLKLKKIQLLIVNDKDYSFYKTIH